MENRELELKDIAGYLPHEPLFINEFRTASTFYYYGSETVIGSNNKGYVKEFYKIVLRPLSDLYRTITHNGEEIIPIVELARLAYPSGDMNWELWQTKAVDKEDGIIIGKFSYNKDEDYFYSNCGVVKGCSNLYDYLQELKVDYRGLIDAVLAISVYDLSENPYK